MAQLIKANKNNDLKYRTDLSDTEKEEIAKQMLESAEMNPGAPDEYFTE